jgi:branched-chain amino acid transport system permease protein
MLGLVSYGVFFAIIVLVFAIAALGLNLQWGSTGLFNAGVVGFFAVGGYALAILTGPDRPELIGGFGLPFVVGLAGAVVASALAALVVGLATIRLREDYLAIATFGTAVTLQLVALNWEGLTGGNLGIAAIPRPLAGVFEPPFRYNVFYLGLMGVAVGGVYWALERIVRSPWGRVLKAIREDEDAVRALGKNVFAYKMQSLVLGGCLGALAGIYFVTQQASVVPSNYSTAQTFFAYVCLILGGTARIWGPVIGSMIFWAIITFTDNFLRQAIDAGYISGSLLDPNQVGQVRLMLVGLGLILLLVFRPQGILGDRRELMLEAR